MTAGHLLIAPRDLLGPAALEAAAALLADGAARTVQRHRVGAWTVLVALGGATRAHAPRPGDLEVTDDRWPDALGWRLELSAGPARPSWSLASDHLGVRPIHWARDDARRLVVSTRPELVAALLGRGLDPVALAEHLLVGFDLGGRTIFTGVHRLRPGERLAWTAGADDVGRRERAARQPDDDPAQWRETLGSRIAESFAEGAALELSGGVDSRLVLALGLAAGARPALAFTLGAPGDEDVVLAAQLCRRLGVRHEIVPAAPDPLRAAEDARLFVARSGFAVNAASSAWLPGAFRSLASLRTAQIGGGGGEIACTFYETPFDPLVRLPGLRGAWVRRRLFRAGASLAPLLVDDAARALAGEVTAAALAALDDGAAAISAAGDALYRRHRVPNAGGPVLAASAHWYRPHQPLLGRAYLAWADGLTPAERRDRAAQRRLVASLAPTIASVAYAGRDRRGRRRSTLARIAVRLDGRRPGADLGAGSAAARLLAEERIRRAVRELATLPDLSLDPATVAQIVDAPTAHEHEAGVLITAALAAEALRQATRDLQRTHLSQELRPCAA